MDRLLDGFHEWDDQGCIRTDVGSTQQGRGFRPVALVRRSSTYLATVRFSAHGSVLRWFNRSLNKPVLAVVGEHCVVGDDFIGGDDGEMYQMRQ